jgi:ribonucleoside-diphosphate reductase alpha chain
MNEAIMNLLRDRYFLQNENSWLELAERVGGIYEPVAQLIKDMKFIPSTPTLMNGNTKGKRLGGLSSCFVMGIDDSIEGIFDALKESAIVTKNAGGIGYDFSPLRSASEEIKSLDGRKSSGPLPFMDMFNSMLDGIRQGGARKGAGGAWLNINHPSILEFIEAKKDYSTLRLNRFNLSVRVPGWFYEKLDNSPDEIMQVKNVTDSKSYDLLDKDGKPVTIRQLWDKIIHLAHASAEPGILNSDIAEKQCTVLKYGKGKVGNNPCTEYVNIPFSSCNLGSINLSKFVKSGRLDWNELSDAIDIATRFLDSVIDNNTFPIEKIEKVTKDIRPIGLGVMGVAHMFMKMGIKFNSKTAYDFSKSLMTYITLRSMKTSIEIAKEKGSYAAFDVDEYLKANDRFWTSNVYDKNGNLFNINVNEIVSDIKKFGIRNSCQTSIAPTGSISYIADSSGGIEPVFALTFARNIEKGKDEFNKPVFEKVFISDPVFDEYLNNSGYSGAVKLEVLEYIAANRGSIQGCPLILKQDQDTFVISSDLTPVDHIDSLEPWAVATSLSISKTVNLPKEATEKDISDAYKDVYKRGVIGVSVYRDGSRGEGVLMASTAASEPIIVKTNAPKRLKVLKGEMHQFVVNKQSYYVATGMLGKDLYEVFTGINHNDDGEVYIPKSVKNGTIIKNGRGDYDFNDEETQTIYHLTNGHSNAEADALTRSISTSLRHGVDISILVQQLEKTKGALNSFAKAITRTLKHYIADGVKVQGEKCPKCGADLIRIEGCKKCSDPECGYSVCG